QTRRSSERPYRSPILKSTRSSRKRPSRSRSYRSACASDGPAPRAATAAVPARKRVAMRLLLRATRLGVFFMAFLLMASGGLQLREFLAGSETPVHGRHVLDTLESARLGGSL